MSEDDFHDLLDQFLEPHIEASPTAFDVAVVWERDNPDFGSLHILELHSVTEEEVEQVILETPPDVQLKRHPSRDDRMLFWGATRFDRWLFISCEMWWE